MNDKPARRGLMSKRSFISMLLAIVIVGGIAWIQRADLMLAMVKFRTERETNVAPHRSITWDQGPAEAAVGYERQPPNIILILADDLGINDISTFGGGVAGGRVTTPNIDELAARGAVFRQAYTGAATCAPSRAMILTGRYPTRTGFEFTPTPPGMGAIVSLVGGTMDRNLPPGRFNRAGAEQAPHFALQGLPPSEITLAEVLRDRGYHTVHIGKWHLGRGEGFAPNDQGFNESLLMASGLYLPENDPEVVNAKLDFDPIDKFLWAAMSYATAFNNRGDDLFEPGGYLTDYWTDQSIEVIRANRHRPFFLYLAHWGPHTPLQATRADYDAVGDIQPHRLRVYAAMIRAIDRSVGHIMATLEEEGLAENTVVLFSSDNGGAGYIGLPDINAPYRGWKATNFEGGLRAPLFMSWPAKIAPGTVSETPVAHIDIMPTLAAAAGAALPADVIIDGRNLLPLATGEADSLDREALFWQSGYYRAVRHGDWKLQVSEYPDKRWLYHLAEDPTEQVNLADERADKVEELTRLLDAHAAEAREPLYPYLIEFPVAIDKTLAERFEPGDEYIIWPN